MYTVYTVYIYIYMMYKILKFNAFGHNDNLIPLFHQVIEPDLYKDSTHIGVCVPSLCLRSMERMLGWHVVLKKFGYPQGAHRQSRPPIRSNILLRIPTGRARQHLQAVKDLREGLQAVKTRRFPSWYLQPFAMPARTFKKLRVSKDTQDFFQEEYGAFVIRHQVIARRKVAMCSIPKVGLTQFYMLMQRVGFRNASYDDFNDPNPKKGSLVATWFASHDWWRDPRWKFAVFVRDPLERFLSAFLDKCLKRSTSCGDDHKTGWQNVTLTSSRSEKLRAFGLFVSLAPTQKMLRDDHWILQSVYLQEGCGFPIHRLDFVGLLMSDKWQVNLQVRAMLHGFGLSLESAKNLADEYFPRKGWADDNQKKHSNIHGGGEGHLFRTFYSQKDCNDETSVDFLGIHEDLLLTL